MTAKHLSKAVLRQDVPAVALRAVLMPDGSGARAATSHHLVWTLFGDSPDRERDFLWREHAPGEFYLLSEREPRDVHGLFDIAPPKLFAPALHPGDRLAFDLRANATVSRGGAPDVRGKPCDIVMDAIHRLPSAARAHARREVLDKVSSDWLSRQGERGGFDVCAVEVTGYTTMSLDRSRGRQGAKIGVLDLRGVLAVREPRTFVAALCSGMGRAKTFGCGLMLIRRA